jgi:hypothetical protein
LVVEQEGYGVREHLAHQPAGKVPQITRPHPLYGVALCELAENSVYSVTKSTEEGALFGSGVSLLGGVRSQKLHTHARQLLPSFRRVVVAVCDDQPRGKLGDLWEHGELVGVSWSHRKTSYDPRPADPNVHTETVEGLLEEDVLTESGFSFEARAAVGASEGARRQGHRIADGEGGIVRSLGQELLPEELLGPPERLAACLVKVVRCTRKRFAKK